MPAGGRMSHCSGRSPARDGTVRAAMTGLRMSHALSANRRRSLPPAARASSKTLPRLRIADAVVPRPSPRPRARRQSASIACRASRTSIPMARDHALPFGAFSGASSDLPVDSTVICS